MLTYYFHLIMRVDVNFPNFKHTQTHTYDDWQINILKRILRRRQFDRERVEYFFRAGSVAVHSRPRTDISRLGPRKPGRNFRKTVRTATHQSFYWPINMHIRMNEKNNGRVSAALNPRRRTTQQTIKWTAVCIRLLLFRCHYCSR